MTEAAGLGEGVVEDVARPYRRDVWTTAAAAELLPHRLRPRLLRRAGLDVDDSALIFPGLRVQGPAPVRIGAGTTVNRDCFLDARAGVDVGTGVGIGSHTRIVTSNHEIGPSHHRIGALAPRPVRIEDGAWLGTGVTVLPGVVVGRGAVVAAGAVVSRDCEPDTLYVGVPARPVRTLA